MKFGPVPLPDAAGAILAHKRTANGNAFKKGRVLTADDITILEQAGVSEVVVAQLEEGDIGEDLAAERIGNICCGPGVIPSTAFASRANLHADNDGILVIDQQRLDQMNRINEGVTLSTIPAFEVVQRQQLVATVKIIPFAVHGSAVTEWETAIMEEGAPIRIAPFKHLRVGLIQTRVPGMREKVLDKTVGVTRTRIETLGGTLIDQIRCDHETDALLSAIQRLQAGGTELILIIGASSIVDRRDVIPAAIVGAGGAVDHYGMPVDPGNLILMGHLAHKPGKTSVLGLPGCARSPKLNGLDWLLRRLMANLPVTSSDIMGMGIGGLLKEIPSRPLPRSEAGEARVTPTPRIGALVLAAGQSRRMGAINKLLAEVDGVSMVVRAVDAAIASSADPVVVVTGHEAERVHAILSDRNVLFAHNPDYAYGLSTSVGAGIAALPPDRDGAVVSLGDMPRVTAAHIDRLIAAFDPLEGRAICVPTWHGKRGNPALFARRFFAEMEELRGDVGAKHLIGEYEDLVVEIAIDDDGVMVDIDSPQALTALTGKSIKQA